MLDDNDDPIEKNEAIAANSDFKRKIDAFKPNRFRPT